ncbi:MAG: hypothetical protein ACTSUP_01650 [Candidatus Heimdallarchaeaceae archaeon]
MMNRETETIQSYIKEFTSWKDELKKYWEAIDRNQEMYEFYKSEDSETQSQISLNTPFAIVESMVSKANDSSVSITVNAKGEKGLQELEKWISSILKDSIEDPDVALYEGTFRKKRERFFRDFLTKGNAVASVEWLKKKDSEGKVIANNPYVKVRDLKSVIFNPTKTLSSSDIYYIESHVKYSDLKKQAYKKNDDTGIYKNLSKLKALADEKDIDIEDEHYYSGRQKITKRGEPIRIIERWEGAKYIVIANDEVIIREDNDPFKIGGHNLITAMDYVVGNRPYAYGEIDAIYMTVRAQDTIINQSIDIINRYLRPSIIVDSIADMDLDQLQDLIENGGVMEGKPEMIGTVPTNVPPSQAFQTVDTLQQAIERAERFSPYATGVPNSAVDKTAGTATGITRMQQASEPNFQIKLDAIEESFMRPVARMQMKMIANLMSPTDFRYGMLQGKTSEWVKAGQKLLQGKPTIKDLLDIGYTTEEGALEYTHTVDPNTMEIIPIPGADKAPVFDIDWLIDVRLDNQSAVEKEEETNKLMAWVQFAQEIGNQFHPERTAVYVAEKQGIEDPENLMLTDDEKREQEQQAMAQQQQEQQQQQQQAQTEQEAQAQQKQAEQQQQAQIDIQKEQLRGQSAERVAAQRNAIR